MGCQGWRLVLRCEAAPLGTKAAGCQLLLCEAAPGSHHNLCCCQSGHIGFGVGPGRCCIMLLPAAANRCHCWSPLSIARCWLQLLPIVWCCCPPLPTVGCHCDHAAWWGLPLPTAACYQLLLLFPLLLLSPLLVLLILLMVVLPPVFCCCSCQHKSGSQGGQAGGCGCGCTRCGSSISSVAEYCSSRIRVAHCPAAPALVAEKKQCGSSRDSWSSRSPLQSSPTARLLQAFASAVRGSAPSATVAAEAPPGCNGGAHPRCSAASAWHIGPCCPVAILLTHLAGMPLRC